MTLEQDFNEKYQELINSYNAIWKDFKIPNFNMFSPYFQLEQDQKQFQDLFALFLKFHSSIINYLVQVNQTYLKSIKELKSKHPDLPNFQSEDEVKEYKNIAIDVFEEYFTKLFQSNEFSITISELLSNYSSFGKLLGNAFNSYLKTLNLPNRSEIDLILRDMQELKRDVHKLEKNLDLIMSEEKEVVLK